MPEWLASRLPDGWTAWHLVALSVGLAVSMAVISLFLVGYGAQTIYKRGFRLPQSGVNVTNRSWRTLDFAALDNVIDIDLKGAFYTSLAVLPMMREQKDGLLIQVSSWAGRYTSPLTGPAYSAAKQGMLAMSESINQEEGMNNIRSCCLCPAEVSTPILDNRPVPVSAEDKARMLQIEDLATMIAFVAKLSPAICVNEILVSPTWNRVYFGSAPKPS